MRKIFSDVRKNTLWRVPVFCIAAGVISYPILYFALNNVTVISLPDYSNTISYSNSILHYGIIMVLVLLIGGRWVAGKMTKKEIFLSASILVILDLLRFMLAVFVEMPTALYVLLLRTANMSHWRQFLYHVFYQVTENAYVGSFIGIFAPYLFVLFGKKSVAMNKEKE